MRRFFLWSSLLLCTDQLSKWWVVNRFELGESLPLISNILHLTYVRNFGAAFGILQGQRWLFIVLSVFVVGWIIVTYRKQPPEQTIAYWGGLLVAAGAVGNLIDRIRLGYVIDFIDLRVWPVFNIADSAITVGVCLLILSSLKPHKA